LLGRRAQLLDDSLHHPGAHVDHPGRVVGHGRSMYQNEGRWSPSSRKHSEPETVACPSRTDVVRPPGRPVRPPAGGQGAEVEPVPSVLATPLITVVVPVYREARCLERLVDELTRATRSVSAAQFELIFVNDGSPDNSLEVLKAIAARRPDCKIVD